MSNKRPAIYVGPGQWKIIDPVTGAEHIRFDEDLNMDVADDFVTELLKDNKADVYVTQDMLEEKWAKNALEAAEEGLEAMREYEILQAKIKAIQEKKAKKRRAKSTANSTLLMATLAAVLQQRQRRRNTRRLPVRSFRKRVKYYKRYYKRKYRRYYRR